MNQVNYFLNSENPRQRQYEALRAFYCDNLPTVDVVKKFGFSKAYFDKLKHQFKQALDQGINPFFEHKKPGPKQPRTAQTVVEMVVMLRKQNYAITDIRAALDAKNTPLSLDKINNILKHEGFATLPKRTHQERVAIQLPKKIIPPASISWKYTDEIFSTERAAGVLIFLPLLESLGIIKAIEDSHFPSTTQLSATQMLLSFLSLKLMGNTRWSHDSVWNMDRALGLFSGLNVLPKATTLSSYSYRVQRASNFALLKNLVNCFKSEQEEDEFNLDFKAIPHWGDESVLEKNWCGARARAMKSILSLIVQCPQSGMINYTDAELKHNTQNDAILDFVDFWKAGKGVAPKMLIFDSRFTTYENLNKLNTSKEQVKFLTIRRRGKKLIEQVNEIPEDEWQTLKIERAKGKKQQMCVHDRRTTLSKYDGEIREIILTEHGRQRPTFLITNDFNLNVKQVIRKYAKRWMVEQEISEQIAFFHLNTPSSSIVVKVDFDLTLSLLAHNLYRHLAQKLHGFEQCNAETIHRDFLDNGATITIKNGAATVAFKKKSHLPILLDVPWVKNSSKLPCLGGMKINFTGHSVT
jgi:Transposase DDE domain